jgi:AmmeMemoRadiSam system protein B/AmmeMemoRadiSam system protein A
MKRLNLLLLFICILFSTSCDDAKKEIKVHKDIKQHKIHKNSQTKSVLNSMFAGSWYSGDEEELQQELNRYLNNVKEKKIKDVIALVLPHAGYRFSGQTAMYGIAEIKGRVFDRVIIIGPSHRYYMKNRISIPDFTHYSTPLGEVELDLEAVKELRKSPYVTNMGKGHCLEHSVQIEVPLLQFGLEKFKIIPVVCGSLDSGASKAIAETLLQAVTPKTLVVISSDFVHYGANFNYIPFKDNIRANIRKIDMNAYEQISRISPYGFRNYCEKTQATICGRNAIEVLLNMLPEDTETTLLKYDTSGRMMSDYSNSVSYMSIAFSGKWPIHGSAESKFQTTASGLNAEEKKNLLSLARETIEYVLNNRSIPSPEDLEIKITPAMKKIMGAFVTLHKNGNLRGCIGEIMPNNSIYQAVLNQAVNSAFNDRRFRPVTKDELNKIDIEISALTPPKKISSWRDIKIGKHGVILRKNGRSAVFLPQVAPEQGWDVKETLKHLSMKAGLKSDAWKKGATFFVFEADVFGENEKH